MSAPSSVSVRSNPAIRLSCLSYRRSASAVDAIPDGSGVPRTQKQADSAVWRQISPVPPGTRDALVRHLTAPGRRASRSSGDRSIVQYVDVSPLPAHRRLQTRRSPGTAPVSCRCVSSSSVRRVEMRALDSFLEMVRRVRRLQTSSILVAVAIGFRSGTSFAWSEVAIEAPDILEGRPPDLLDRP